MPQDATDVAFYAERLIDTPDIVVCGATYGNYSHTQSHAAIPRNLPREARIALVQASLLSLAKQIAHERGWNVAAMLPAIERALPGHPA